MKVWHHLTEFFLTYFVVCKGWKSRRVTVCKSTILRLFPILLLVEMHKKENLLNNGAETSSIWQQLCSLYVYSGLFWEENK